MNDDDQTMKATETGDPVSVEKANPLGKPTFRQILRQVAVDSWQIWTSRWFWGLALVAALVHTAFWLMQYNGLLYATGWVSSNASKANEISLQLAVFFAAISLHLAISKEGDVPRSLFTLKALQLVAGISVYFHLFFLPMSSVPFLGASDRAFGLFLVLLVLMPVLVPQAFIAAARVATSAKLLLTTFMRDLLIPRPAMLLATVTTILLTFMIFAFITAAGVEVAAARGALVGLGWLVAFVPVIATARRYVLVTNGVA